MRKSIYGKIRAQVLLGSFLAAGAVCLAAVICIAVMRGSITDISNTLGQSAAVDSKAALEAQMEESLLRLAGNKAAISDEKLAAVAKLTARVARNAGDILSNPSGYLPQTVAYPSAANAGKVVAQLRLPEGADAAAMEDEIGLLGNIAGIRWYTAAKEAGGIIWTDVFADNSGRGLAITCAAPFYGAGDTAGVAGAGMQLEVLTEIVVETQLGETGYAFIANERGEIIIADSVTVAEDGSIDTQELAALLPADTAGRMRSGETGIERVSISGSDSFIAYSPMQTLPWSLAVVMSVDEVIAPATLTEQNIMGMTGEAAAGIDRMILIALAVFAAALALTFIGNTVMSRRLASGLAKPIIELSEGAGIIGAGDLDHRLDVKTGDELETLSDSFNSMIDNIKRITAEKERIGAELNVATQIQASMLPCIFPAFPERDEFDIYASMQPAKEVGGDFYDFFLIDEDTLAVVMADVSGKGVPAALFMVITKTLIQNTALSGKTPEVVFGIVNRMLCDNNSAGMFVTAMLGYLDIPTGKFTFVNAGHNPPLIRRNGKFEWLKGRAGFVLAGDEDTFYRQQEIEIKPGDELFLYTDGVTEAVNRQNELFTDPRLLETANANLDKPLRDFTLAIKSAIDTFADGAEQADDITMLALRYRGK